MSERELKAEIREAVEILESVLELEGAMLPECREPATECGCTFCDARLFVAKHGKAAV